MVATTPTWSGKSLPGQLVSLLWPGTVTVIVAPLITVAVQQAAALNLFQPSTACILLASSGPNELDEVKHGKYPIGEHFEKKKKRKKVFPADFIRSVHDG